MASDFERLLEELGTRSRAEIDQVGEAARARAASIDAASVARITERRAAALASCDEEGQRDERIAVAAARLCGRRSMLAAQQALVDRVMDAAHDATHRRLASGLDADVLMRRAAELLSYAGTGDVEIRCRTVMACQITPLLAADARIRVVADDAAPWGFTLIADGGRLSVDDTVESWLSGRRDAIAIEVCRAVEESA
jgi:vacuolar-type H+-ATPase subunit E/Vma4